MGKNEGIFIPVDANCITTPTPARIGKSDMDQGCYETVQSWIMFSHLTNILDILPIIICHNETMAFCDFT